MKSEESSTLKFVCVIVSLAALIPSYWWRGYVASILWRWFVSEPYGLPEIGIAIFCGIVVLVHLVLPWDIKWDKKETTTLEETSRMLAASVFIPALALLSGWVITLF